MTSIIIQARTGSTRLPGKVLEMLQGKTVLEHVIGRARKVRNVEQVILATTDKEEDDVLAKIGAKMNIPVFRGSENDVLDRYYRAAGLFKADPIVRITADCPMLDPNVAEQVVDLFRSSNYDYVSNVRPATFPDGLDVEVFSFAMLEKCWKEAKLASEREHAVGGYLTNHLDLFRLGNFTSPVDHSHLRVTLDERVDLEIIKKIYQELYHDNNCFGLNEIVELFKRKPELAQINKHIGRNEGYLNSLKGDKIVNRNGMINSASGQNLWRKAKKIIPGGTQLLSKRPELFLPEQWPSYYKKAEGSHIWDLDGNKFLEISTMGIGSCILGYADKDVNDAIKKVLDDGSMATLNSPEEVELAELLLKIHPWAQMVRYARTGGEAMSIAVRIARAYSKRDGIAFCGYHGWSDWYLAANLAENANLDGHLLPGLVPLGVPRGLTGTAIPFHYNNLNELKDILAKNKNIGVIVMEPLRYQDQKNNFLQEVQALADEIGAVLIYDEITSGWRFNVGGAHLKYGINPDIAVFAKAMSNGVPMAAIIGKQAVMQVAQETFISSTYWTERIGPVAAIATINKIIEKDVPNHLSKIGLSLQEGLRNLACKHELKLSIGGLPQAFHFDFEYGDDSLALKTLFTQEMLRRNILASGGVYIAYSLTPEHVQQYLNTADEVFALLKRATMTGTVKTLLEGPIIQTGFKRLT